MQKCQTKQWSYHGSDETLIFWRFTSEAIANKANLSDHSLPCLFLSLSSFDDFKHFCLSLGTHFGQGHLPFALQENITHYIIFTHRFTVTIKLIHGKCFEHKQEIFTTAYNLTKKGAAGEQKLTAFSFLFCLIMLDRTLARDCPSLSNRYAGTAPSGVLSSFFCLVFLCSCIFMLQHTNQYFMSFSLILIFMPTSFSLNWLTFSSSGSSLHVSVCGTIWPSNQSTSWLCGTAHEPHDFPSSFSFHGGRGDSHAACDVTQCARSGATKEKANMHFNSCWSQSIINV